MLLHSCNHKHAISPQTLPNPIISIPSTFFFPIPLSRYPKFHPRLNLRRTSVAATADAEILSKSAIQRIAEKLRSLGYVSDDDDKENAAGTPDTSAKSTSPGQIFVPLPKKLPKYRVGHTLDQSWSTPENPAPGHGTGNAIRRFQEPRRDFAGKDERVKKRGQRREEAPTLAELALPGEELRRLRSIGIRLRKKLMLGKAGITEGIVNGIHERWRHSEVVKIKCEDICKMNMKRTHDLLERKTGGLVIWRSGSTIILYRGANYKYPYFLLDNNSTNDTATDGSSDLPMKKGLQGENKPSSATDDGLKLAANSTYTKVDHPRIVQGVGSPKRVRFQLPGEALLVEEADKLLEGLGPRFTDWWGSDPVPVDADLLPAVVPGYRRPFRLLPYGVKPKLTNDEMTILKRLGRPLPCHFALGRSQKLEGLAASIVKLWEKCEIVKVAIKREAQNANSRLMADELKYLTGGLLISRDREFIVLYRGKDFLPACVSSAIEERRKSGLHKEQTRVEQPSGDECDELHGQTEKVMSEQSMLRLEEAASKRISDNFTSPLLAKKSRVESRLAEMGHEEIPQKPAIEKEGITEEERYMLRKVGLKMKPFLLLGRRGVFDGTVENMHLHWKYRELVKVICGNRSIEEVHEIARTLEAESGGILVAVEPVSKGYAIITYRGKNYKRPASLRPQSLLTKREALKRYVEAQRREALKLDVLKLGRNVDDLKLQLAKDMEKSSMQLDKESRFESIKEMEAYTTQSTEYRRSNTDLETNDRSSSASPACSQLNVEKEREQHEADSNSVDFNIGMDASRDSMSDEDEFDVTKQAAFSKSVVKEANTRTDISGEAEGKSKLRVDESNGTPFRARRLSNRERLLLRKQALRMKKRPVLAVGKSNVVTGVARTIKTHFKKHPLAIVNVKARAKGTSLQEVVLKLEEATGAIFVSQEPNKVILYRGWGAGEEDVWKSNESRYAGAGTEKSKAGPLVSPDLMAAIRLECGLKHDQDEE